MAYSKTETELETRLSEYITPVGLYSKKVTLIIEVYMNGSCVQISIKDSERAETIQEKVEKGIRGFLSDVYGTEKFTLEFSSFIKSYLLSSFSNEWVEDPFWNRRFLNLDPITLKRLE